MPTPWFDPNWFGGLYGGIVGGVGGTLIGLFGALSMYLALQGKARGLVFGGFGFVLLFGVANLIVGLYALYVKQPYSIWYPLVLIGVLMTILPLVLLAQLRTRYAQADARRLDAQTFRSA